MKSPRIKGSMGSFGSFSKFGGKKQELSFGPVMSAVQIVTFFRNFNIVDSYWCR